jgi:hypothetical protein
LIKDKNAWLLGSLLSNIGCILTLLFLVSFSVRLTVALQAHALRAGALVVSIVFSNEVFDEIQHQIEELVGDMVLILFGEKESDWTLRMDKLSLLLFLSSFSDVVSSFLFLAINISIF